MAGNTRRITYNNVNKHPEDSILLAYLRGQELGVRPSVIQHINEEKCQRCLQKLNELEQVSATLDVLGDIRSYQHYPELSVVDTYARMQRAVNGVNHRQRPRKSAVRWISVPVAFGLAILFTMSMLVFANLSGRSLNPSSSSGGMSPGQNILTVAVPPHAAPTQEATLTTTGIVTPDKPSEAKTPYMKVCSTKANIDQLRLVICGFHFDSAHKTMLIAFVPGKRAILLRDIPVDNDGTLQVGWKIADCTNMPTMVFGYEATSSKPIFVILHITSFGNCTAQTPNSVVGPSGVSTNSGK
jgi:hypothetical protein